ncbi:hypothetical protein SAMD00019534_047660 [Acytostelium subglobosum LB1]|uniref:hypothetical protein n=1 Tax=Acytostelium subglobosum LB1 TaxID=1410327 RepID=UPI0006449203|nr:hypothetical protein SAMD00019534_047660 [Acytostelium subglobosum LB1]GAM21591.1 hypothetical protein SAMD00019534_047660 [Acytostelium subglobosum LB1]|eukprot:XP_012755710.1 hypothetical protein SAMD00019534_047660 [Acytostelium subglobosum LB1]
MNVMELSYTSLLSLSMYVYMYKERLSGNIKIMTGLVLFSSAVYFYSMYKMGQNDFKDINDFGIPTKDDSDLHLKKRPRGSGPQ